MGATNSGFKDKNQVNVETLVNEDYSAHVTVPGATSAFGELSVAQFEPLISWSFPYNINPLLIKQEIVSTGTITQGESSAILQTGAALDGKAKIETVKGSRYIPGIGGLVRFTTVFDTPVADSRQVQGLINSVDGWGFGYDGTRFGIVRIKDDVKYWIYQEDWNEDKKLNLNPQKGNIYQIEYQWLGFGEQIFSMENDYGRLTPVHKIMYSNLNDFVSISNPNLPLSACVENLGNTSNLTLKTPSAVAGLIGNAYNDSNSVHLAEGVQKDIVAGTLIPLISFRMEELYKLKANRLFTQAIRLGLSASLNKTARVIAYGGGIVTGGAWNYLYEDAAPIEANITFTAYTPGIKVGSFPLGKESTLSIDLESSRFKLYAGQMVTLVLNTTGTGEISVGVDWKNFV